MSEDEEAEDLSGILRGSLEENPGSNGQAREDKRRPSESSVSNTSPTHRANTLSPEKSLSSFSRMRSPTTGFTVSPNNSALGPTSPDFVGGGPSFAKGGSTGFELSPNYGHQPDAMLSHPGISPDVVEVKAWILYH